MVVGQSPVSHQAGADALPLRDAFGVLFFASVGMLFDPWFLIEAPALVLAGVGIVMLGKPLAALALVAIIGYPARTAVVVAVALAQIGEFSFILSNLGQAYKLVDAVGHNLLVACAIVSITLNPLLFRTVPWIERRLQAWPALWRFMNRGAGRRETRVNEAAGNLIERSDKPLAVIVGYGPVGRAVDSILAGSELETVIVDLNMDTVQDLTKRGRAAIYGDAFNIEVMHQALGRATHLIVSLPHSLNRTPLIAAAKLINPDVKVFVRAHYLREREDLEQAGADAACYEEAEAAVALSRLVLFDTGAEAEKVRRETTRIRQRFMVQE
jgi:CPA2 family monovalent cation:H+ antiporter-2